MHKYTFAMHKAVALLKKSLDLNECIMYHTSVVIIYNTQYIVSYGGITMWMNTKNPNISWISSKRENGSEWTEYTKEFTLNNDVKSALFRFENDCTCAVFVNGEFIASGTGRMPERISCHEITSKLHKGKNTVKMVLGTYYFQGEGTRIKEQRGYWFDSAAFELCAELTGGEKVIVSTDGTWKAVSDGKEVETIETCRVTDMEYSEFWNNAALWVEPELHPVEIAPEVIDVVGKEYADYAAKCEPVYVSPVRVVETNLKEKDGVYTVDKNSSDEQAYILYDFGHLVVGFTEIDYCAKEDTQCVYYHDFSEDLNDFLPTSKWRYKLPKLSVTEALPAKENTVLTLRRRAFRYLKIVFDKDKPIEYKGVRVRMCTFPVTKKGYFRCNDQMLNKAWEVGKYTLHVNKQQEYESCPRNEMQFFSGDGAIDALIDFYAYGNDDLMNASLSIKHDERSTGVTHTPFFNRITIQWDYFAWRIICIYLHYKTSGDKEFAKHYFDEAEKGLIWQLERLNKNNLMFQRPCIVDTFVYATGQTEWSCSNHRLGEKVALNCLLYKSLISMSEMANDIGETEKSKEWAQKAEVIKKAINERLWNEEKQCYMDTLDDFVAQDGNTLAVMFGVADPCRAAKVLDTMKKELWTPYGSTILNKPIEHTRGGNTTISPLMCAWEAQARFQHGSAEEAMELMRRCWGTMIKKGAETFWEFSPNNDTERWEIPSHAWSSGIVYLLSGFVMGVRPQKSNYDEMIFEPKVCDLTEIAGVVPTPKGFVGVKYETLANGVKKFRLALPKAIKLTTKLPENSEIEVIEY